MLCSEAGVLFYGEVCDRHVVGDGVLVFDIELFLYLVECLDQLDFIDL